MSTTTNMHGLDTIVVTKFAATDDNHAFVSVTITDGQRNVVTLFPTSLDQFVADVTAAAANPRMK